MTRRIAGIYAICTLWYLLSHGDSYGGVLEHSFTCKFYRGISKNQPFEYMTGRCDPNLRAHTVSKTRDRLEQAAMLTCAHHGATLFIDAIDPCGTMDAHAYGLMGRVFETEMPYEPYLPAGFPWRSG